MTKTATMNQVVHFEIPYDDIEKAKEFYSIFDWELNDIPGMDYVGVRTAPVDEPRCPVSLSWLSLRDGRVRCPLAVSACRCAGKR